MLRLAHLSDIHLAPMPVPRMRDMSIKRALGYANWQRGRRRAHLRPVLDNLMEDINRLAPDHIALTGDLVNIGLPREFETAAEWLELVGPPDRITVVPGNHDAYVRLNRDVGIARWKAYMTANSAGADYGAGGLDFPFVRILDGFALIGLNSAIPTMPFSAAGRLGERQRAALEIILGQLRGRELVRIVLIHHPPLPGQTSRRRALQDAGEMAGVLARQGAELILHGHNHTQTLVWAEGREGRIPVVGVPSASYGQADGHDLARYNLFRIEREGRDCHITMAGRGIGRGGVDVTEIELVSLSRTGINSDEYPPSADD